MSSPSDSFLPSLKFPNFYFLLLFITSIYHSPTPFLRRRRCRGVASAASPNLRIKNPGIRYVQLFFLFFFYFFCMFHVIFSRFSSSVKSNSKDYPWEIYTVKELLQATNNFHESKKIGEGGFGSVYRGQTSKGAEAITSIFLFFYFLFNLIGSVLSVNKIRIALLIILKSFLFYFFFL